MYSEKISACMANNPYIKPQQGAKFRAIKRAEYKLKIAFPAELKTLLTEVNGDEFLLLSAKQIVECNLSVRKQLGEVYNGLDSLLFIAENGCGDYYSYQISDGKITSTEIVRWDHEDNSTFSVARNLEQLIEKYYTNQI